MASMTDAIKSMIEERGRVWHEAKAILDRETDETRSLTAEETETYERMNARLGELDARIEEFVKLDEANKKADAYRERYESVVPADVRQNAESTEERQLREFMAGERKHVDLSFRGLHNEVNEDSGSWQLRDLSTVTATAGGNTVPTSFVRTLYAHMIENAAIRQTNVRVIPTNSGEALQLPKATGFGAAAIVGEGSALAENDPTFGQLTLHAWKYAQLLQYSSELVADTGVDLLGFLAEKFGQNLGNASGAHFITGTGTNQPNGVVTAIKANSGTAVQGTASLEADNLIDLYYSVFQTYADRGFWMMRRATEGKIRKLRDNDGQYLWQPSLQVGTPNQLLGRPIVTDPNMAAVGSANMSVIFGDFSGYVIRDVAGVRIERSDDYAFNTDQVTWRAIIRTDGDLLDTTGAIKGLDTDTA